MFEAVYTNKTKSAKENLTAPQKSNTITLMKVKYIGPTTCLRTNGKVYDVIREYKHGRESVIVIKDDEGEEYDFYLSSSFVALPEDPIEEKEKEIEAARKILQEAENKVSILEKQLAALKAPKVGDKYEHHRGSKFIVTNIQGQYSLVCYEGDDAGMIYGSLVEKINDVFAGFNHKFTKIS